MTISPQSNVDIRLDNQESGPGLLPCNVDKYMTHFEDVDITDEEAITLIHMLYDIMAAFVDLGFAIHPVQNKALSGSTHDEDAQDVTLDCDYQRLDDNEDTIPLPAYASVMNNE